jgi:tetratricopeptide (TPR) repeat protein
MRSTFLTVLLLSVFIVGHSQQSHREMQMGAAVNKPATLVSGMGSLHHPVSTTNPEAQKFFDQGLSFVYAFNHDEAVRSFKRAAELDPGMAMAYWGIALALGPNINLDVDPEREKAAYDSVQKALAMVAKDSGNEQAYIEALAKRYSTDPKADLKRLAVDYKNAMGELVKRFPDDLDAATLFAESAMDLRPWQLWTADGKPAEGTEEIIAVLESVIRRNPNHVGAIHYYVHAVEASLNPERALAYAPKLATLMPAAGHIVHMPAHIFQRTGNYGEAARSNEQAAAADRAYIQATGAKGVYPLMYYSHNLHFLAIAYNMEGRFAEAMKAARQLEENVAPHLKEMPMLEGFMTVTPLLLARFQRWDEIEKLPQPDASLIATNAVFHFIRGLGSAAKGRTAEAEAELNALIAAEKRVPADASFGLNPTGKILKIAETVLMARISAAKHDDKSAIKLLRDAVELEDVLAYDEPPVWFTPVRESLGGVLLRSGNYAEAEEVFRADLEKNRRNGRSLFGLLEALKAQKKVYAASFVQQEFETAWKNAETKLTIADL